MVAALFEEMIGVGGSAAGVVEAIIVDVGGVDVGAGIGIAVIVGAVDDADAVEGDDVAMIDGAVVDAFGDAIVVDGAAIAGTGDAGDDCVGVADASSVGSIFENAYRGGSGAVVDADASLVLVTNEPSASCA